MALTRMFKKALDRVFGVGVWDPKTHIFLGIIPDSKNLTRFSATNLAFG